MSLSLNKNDYIVDLEKELFSIVCYIFLKGSIISTFKEQETWGIICRKILKEYQSKTDDFVIHYDGMFTKTKSFQDIFDQFQINKLSLKDFWRVFCMGKSAFISIAIVQSFFELFTKCGYMFIFRGKEVINLAVIQLKITHPFEQIVITNDQDKSSKFKPFLVKTLPHYALRVTTSDEKRYLCDFTFSQFGWDHFGDLSKFYSSEKINKITIDNAYTFFPLYIEELKNEYGLENDFFGLGQIYQPSECNTLIETASNDFEKTSNTTLIILINLLKEEIVQVVDKKRQRNNIINDYDLNS
jgi:hypothetical protein